MKNDPRRTALNLLLSWEKSIFTLDHCLEQYQIDIDALPKKDRALFNTLVFGVLRHRLTLDWMIETYSRLPLKKINLSALYILRLVIFQLIYLDRIPGFAAIDTGVEMAKQTCNQKTAGFINAVSRKVLNNQDQIIFPDAAKQPAKHFSIQYAMPIWLVKKWISAYGFKKTQTLCQTINQIPPITIRANTLKIDRQTLVKTLEPVCRDVCIADEVPDGIHFQNPDTAIHNMDAFKLGYFQIQDEAAQMVSLLLNPKPGECVLDACAGLGGKTGHMAQMMKNSGKVMALDIEKKKLQSLEREAERLGLCIVETCQGDILKMTIKHFDGYFDRVLVDAPCTGLGVIRRNPDSKWRRQTKDIMRLAAQQKKILNAASNLVRPGGSLVYAVCSCEKEENQDVIHTFLKKRKDFFIDMDVKSKMLSSFISGEGFLKTYPDHLQMDGFFAVRLKRKL